MSTRELMTRAQVRPIWHSLLALVLLCTVLLLCGVAMGGVTASISGTVKDTSGAAIVGATVTAKNIETGITETQSSNEQGFYSFQALPLGHYDIEVQQSGFKMFRHTGLLLEVNAARVVDAVLELGAVQESVVVTSTAVHVETASTQLGEVIPSPEIIGVPLVTRSYTDLLALQPGVVSSSSGMTGGGAGGAGGNFISAGFSVPLVSGDLNAGNLSVNGMREAANGFLLNGATVQEFGFSGTAVVPNLDSIEEFRILTNNFDAEYGNYSGGQINVITKSGGNTWHGSAFEFLRNTNLDAANYFDQGKRGAYHQNQFGGTFGGPIRKNKLFFFADYQGNRKVVGLSSGLIGVPSLDEKKGEFSALASQMNKIVQGDAWAQHLSSVLGYPVTAGMPYYTPGCTSSAQCVFPNAQIPTSAFSAPAVSLLPYILDPNSGSFFSTSAFSQQLRDDKTSGRLDADTHFGLLSGYYFFDQYTLNNPYMGSGFLPGFNNMGTGRTQVINLGDTKTFGGSAVNEFRFQFVRVKDGLNQPSGGKGVTLSSLGFQGIVPLAPSLEGVPEIDFNSFALGVPSRVLGLTENTYQWLDNYSKVIGTHTLKFGGSYHYTQLQENLNNVMNGQFQFFGTETGIDFADFLLGAPTFYIQGQAPPSRGRSRYAGLYAQDSWRFRPNLTLNYGVRWEFSTPWYEVNNNLETLVPGLQSRVFPGAPTGWVFPGDPGIPRTLAPTRYNNFAPRAGLAWSPHIDHGFISKLTGGPGQTSIRAGFGMFYTSFEGATNFNEIGDAPYGFYYQATIPVMFTNPFVNRLTGQTIPQKFPVQFPPNNVSARNPDNSVDWSVFTPISSSPGFWYKNRLPYAEDYEVSVQRQFSTKTLLTLSYVGTQGHNLLSTLQSNPGSPGICNYLTANGAMSVTGKPQPCGPGGENLLYVLPPGVATPAGAFTQACPQGSVAGTCIPGTRSVFTPQYFGSNGYFMTIGQSGYNSVQLNVRHNSGPLQLMVGYTYSKSMDNASGYGEQVNPFVPKNSMGLSAFDVTHNFVVSYNYQLPFDKLGWKNRFTQGWQLSGITRFTTGVPVTIYDMSDNSLLGTAYTGPMPIAIDTPNYAGGAIHFNDPRSGQPYFNVSGFSPETIGQLGTARRRFFHGPGSNNWDMALLKDTKLTERMTLQFRAEMYNIFNHAQFTGVNGNFSSGLPIISNGVNTGGTFGMVTSAASPRIGQLSLKLLF